MVALSTAEAVRPEIGPEQDGSWHPLVRVLFRFGFVFVGVGMAGVWLAHALLRSFGVSQQTVTRVGEWASLHPLTDWIGLHIFDVRVDYTPTGIGDTATHWVSLFTLLFAAVLATVVWSVLDRRRLEYVRLYAWFRLLLRANLISALLLYGMMKMLPSQMSFNLDRLVQPFGEMSPMSVLWAQTSVSEPYEIALGAAEVTAALLLVLPVTAGLGSNLAAIVALQVFVLNLTFDVPVKIFSFQLLVYALVLAAPDIRRIVLALIGRALPPRLPDLVLATTRGNRILLAGQVLFGIWLLFTTVVECHDAWRTHGTARPQSPLYGIWNVTEYTVADQQLPPLIDYSDASNTQIFTPADRFRRIIFDIPIGITVQRMNDSLQSFPARIDTDRHTITLSKDLAHQYPFAVFGYEQPQPDQLILTGTLSGRPVRIQLDLVDLDRYPVVSRGFNWVQPAPYFR
ncbi:DoxX family protein [Nocardia crassostreae]|uniref:DoxX family protein n=1 Tax=Nocardia crassostreae TaxID=53428 RepID=UPI000ABAD1AD|nr:DoxX family protein [Nocardia crassostreae]